MDLSRRRPSGPGALLAAAAVSSVVASCAGCHGARPAPPARSGATSAADAGPGARAPLVEGSSEASGEAAPRGPESPAVEPDALRARGEVPADAALPETCRRARAALRIFLVDLPRGCEAASDCEAMVVGVPCEGTTVYSRGALEAETRARWEELYRRARSDCPPPSPVCGPPLRVHPVCREGRCLDPARPDAWP